MESLDILRDRLEELIQKVKDLESKVPDYAPDPVEVKPGV